MEWGYRRKIELQESMIKLVAEKAALSNQAKDEVEKQFNAFKTDVAANAGKDVLAARAEKVEIALDQFVAANNEVNSAVGIIAYPAPRGPRAAVLHQ